MNNVFNEYAHVYDLLYEDKDYKNESLYIHQLIRQYAGNARTILDLGCGTGRHAIELSKNGYDITGVDFSPEMLKKAHLNAQKQGVKCTFIHGDVRNISLEQKFDVVLALFHVASYQTTNEDLSAFFQTVRNHLDKNGIFIFDFWYGPSVLNDMPSVRIKKFENEEYKLVRISDPGINLADNLVDVNFEIIAYNKKNQTVDFLNEMHHMRYLFLPELQLFLKSSSLNLCKVLNWLKTDETEKITSWYGVIIAKPGNQ
jgi:SAM-dependent methyltransferase